MNKTPKWLERIAIISFLLAVTSYGAGTIRKGTSPAYTNKIGNGTNDIAFVSVWGSRPKAEKLKGFQHAVLYNARGEVVHKIDMDRDSIYSLDKMIQENKTRGPLFIRMYRR
jgi:hypothetical protein